MAFSLTSPPKRSGDYTRFIAKQTITVPPSQTQAIVAVPFTDDWGPFKTFVSLNSFDEYLQIYGAPVDPASPSPGYIAVYNAFRGENSDTPGAGTVLAYRTGASSAAKGVGTLQNATPAAALILTARYEGSFSGRIKYEVVASASNPSTQRDLRIYVDGVQVEEYKGYTAAQVTDLRDAINANSGWVTASGALNGALLALVAATALGATTAGASGHTLIAGDWTDVMTALEPQRFGYLAPYNLTDGSVITALKTWAIDLNNRAKSKRFFTFIGGAAAESYDTAATRSSGINDENVVNLGVGTYRDSTLAQNLSTAQLAPRLAGAASALGGASSLSFSYLEDLSIVVGPTDNDILASLEAGVVLLSLGSGGVHVERGVTTYVKTTANSASTADKPWKVYSNLKFVTTMQSFERTSRERNENGKRLGKLPVNNDTREFLVDDEQRLLNEYVLRHEVQPGARVVLASNPPITDEDEYIAIEWYGKFGRTAEQIRRTIYMS